MSHSRIWLAVGTLCLSCGSNFVAADNGGTAGSAGMASSSGGSVGAAGAPGGGAAGRAGAGGASTRGVSTGGASAGGASAGSSGAAAGGSSAGAGGSSTGGGSGAGGSAGAEDCATLKTEYAAAVEKARVCDSGSTDECSTSSTEPAVGCGCPTPVNAKSMYTTIAKQKYQAIQDANCAAGPICNIACIAYTSVSCSAQAGTPTTYECVGTSGVATN